MSGVVSNLKKFFNKTEGHHLPSFRSAHFLNSLPQQNISEILHLSQKENFSTLLPDISDKKSLLISSTGLLPLVDDLLKCDPFRLINYQITPAEPVKNLKVINISGNLQTPALKPNAFDILLLPAAGLYQTDFIKVLNPISKTLVNQGKILIGLAHPMLLYLLTNQNPHSLERSQSSLQNIFSQLREMNFYIEALSEGYLESSMRPLFVDHLGQSHFEEYHGLPLLLLISAVKFVR